MNKSDTLLLGILGLSIITISANFGIALGVYLMLWAYNIDRDS